MTNTSPVRDPETDGSSCNLASADLEGNYLKTGITSNPAGRYTQEFMSDKFMDIINVGSRSNMMDLERQIVEVDPGPLNFEPWAGVTQ